MGVPLNTLLTFFACQILIFGPVSGLPFSSISSLSSLKSVETSSTNETASSTLEPVSNTGNIGGLITSSLVPGTLSSKSCQLFIGAPDVNTNFFSSQTPSLTIGVNNEQVSTADTSNTKLFTSLNLQSNLVSPSTDPASSSSSIEGNLDESISISGLSIIPTLNLDFDSSNFKRELRDTMSVLEPCLTNSNSNFGSTVRPGFAPNYAINSPFSPNPCLKMPLDLTQASDECTNIPSNAVQSDCPLPTAIPCQCPSLVTNVGPSVSLQNNLMSPQSNLLEFNSIVNRAPQSCPIPNRFNLQQNTPFCTCVESGETIHTNTPSGSLFDALSSFADIKKYINSRQTLQVNSGSIQNQPSIETNICPCQVNQMNNNLMYAKALQNKIASEQLNTQSNQPICNNNVQNFQTNECSRESTINSDLAYDNILNIRNNVIPKLQLDNAVVKNIVQNTAQNGNDYSLGCPQLQTSVCVEENSPVIQNNNVVLNPANNCVFTGPTIPFNNVARMLKDNLDNSNDNFEITQVNNNQGCPQLMSIPVYNRDSLQNKQIISLANCNYVPISNNNLDVAQALQNNNIRFNNDNAATLNQNNLGCTDLLTIAQNKLNARDNCDTNNVNVVVSNQYCDCLDGTLANIQSDNNCNAIQTFIPSDNLVQALKRINEAKLNQQMKSSAASINILPFGQTIIDGAPVPNNFVALDSTVGPVQSSCSDSTIPNNYLTIQDVSRPLPFIPVNPFLYCTPSEVPVNIPKNIILSPTFSLIDNASPLVTNIMPPVMNVPVYSPNIAAKTEAPVSQLFINNQDLFYQTNNCGASPTVMPFVSPNFIPVQSLPQVSFVNNLPSSTFSVAPAASFSDNLISSISNLPPTCTSIQPILPSSCLNPLVTANTPQVNSVFPCLNNIVNALTQSIISTLKTKIPSAGIPLALPPVNPYTLTDPSSFCFESASPLNIPRTLADIPVACNEYLPPLALVPLTSFNSDLFGIEPDETFDSCSPFALSKTDAYYPELSFVVPSVQSSDCSCLSGPLFMPVSSLPQSSPVLKINNTGREAKCYEQLVKSVVL